MWRVMARAPTGPHAEGVAIGGGFGDCVDADGERAAGPVVDHDGLAELSSELGRDNARDVIGGATRGLRNDEADRPLGVLRSDRPRSPEGENQS